MFTGYSLYIYLALEIMMMFAIYRFLNSFHENAVKNKKIEIISYIAYFLVNILAYRFIRIPVLMSIVNIIIIFLITLNYRTNYKKKMLSTVLLCFIIMCSEKIIQLLTDYYYTEMFTQVEFPPITSYIIYALLSILVIMLFCKMMQTKNEQVASRIYWLCIGMDFLVILYLIFLFSLNNDLLQISILFIIVLVSNCTVLYLYDVTISRAKEREENLVILEEKKSYQKQIEFMNMYSQNLHTFRHDLKNHALLIKNFIKSGDEEEALAQLELFNDTVNEKKGKKTIVTIIDSILDFKIFEAEYHGIHVDFRVIIPYDITYDEFDMTILFGNLMDFAIRELKKVEDSNKKEILLRVIFEFDRNKRGWLKVKMVYPVVKETITVELIEEGLKKNVEKIVEKYEGYATYGTVDNNFEVNIKMLLLREIPK